MVWVRHSEDMNIPEWLKKGLSPHCKCGTEKENFYNNEGLCTARRCPNKVCPETLAQKIAGMCDILQVKGIAEGTGRKLISEYNLKSHFEVVPYIFSDKPTITLYQLLRITFIQGVDTRWESVCAGKSSVDELLEKYKGDLRSVIDERIEEIRYGETFFNIYEEKPQQFKPLVTGTVMISGHINGFTERDNFIHGINLCSKGLVSLGIAQNKRKTGIMCLIQEADEPNRGKAECAIENRIPIMTPDEFKTYITNLLRKRLEEEHDN